MRITRPCYDKYHRCPGWAGPGLKIRKGDGGCPCGYIRYDPERLLWRWRTHRCNKCDRVVLPYNIRWVDPSWLRHWAGWRVSRWRGKMMW